MLLDVRERWEWETARIAGAQHIPMRRCPAGSKSSSETGTVTIRHHGGRSLQVAMFLEKNGFAKVHNLRGVDAWSRTVDPAVPLY